MPAPAFILGVDVGRLSLGLILLDGQGTVAGVVRRAYGNRPGEPTDPQDWWRAVRTGIKDLLRKAEVPAERIRAVGLSGDSQGYAACNRDGKALCATVLGPDPRATDACAELLRLVGARNLANLSGGTASTAATAAKLLWLKNHEKRVWHDLGWVLPAKDFIRFRLTGVATTDAGDAAATLLFNPKGRAWSKQLAQTLGINTEWLPPVAAGTAMTGRVTDAAARESGLAAGTPVICGAGHAAATAIAAGVLVQGSLLIELGGTGAVLAPCADGAKDPQQRLRTSCHAMAGRGALEGAGIASAEILDWLTESLMASEAAQARRNGREPLDLLAELASEIAPGSDGLLCVPAGRGPAALVGMRAGHDRGHLVRAALESGALAARDSIDACAAAGVTIERIIAAGPGATGSLWSQILADALDRPVEVAQVPEAAAYGAAILSTPTVGIHKSLEGACQVMLRRHGPLTPRRAAAEVYNQLAPRLRRSLAALAEPDETAAPEA